MENKTIIYIGGFELPDKNAAAHRVINNGKALKDLGYNVVFVGVNHESSNYDNGRPHFSQISGFEVWEIPYPKTLVEWVRYLGSINKFRYVYKKYSNVKVVICYNYQSVAFIQLLFFCRRKRIKLVADCTEWYGKEGKSLFRNILKEFDTFFRMKFIHFWIDGIIVISKYLEKYYSKRQFTILIPPLVDKQEEKWKNNNKDRLITSHRFSLVYFGSPGFSKDNLNLFVNALSKLKNEVDFELKIIGITKGKYLEMYPEASVIVNDPTLSIFFYGRIEHIRCLDILASSDFSIFLREINRVTLAGFPTKLVESLSARIPVITNDNSNIKDYIRSGKNGFIIGVNMVEDLKTILSMPREEIQVVKMEIDDNMFDYRKNTDFFAEFLSRIFEKN